VKLEKESRIPERHDGEREKAARISGKKKKQRCRECEEKK